MPVTSRYVEPVSCLQQTFDGRRSFLLRKIIFFAHHRQRSWRNGIRQKGEFFFALTLNDENIFNVVMPVKSLFPLRSHINLNVDRAPKAGCEIVGNTFKNWMGDFGVPHKHGVAALKVSHGIGLIKPSRARCQDSMSRKPAVIMRMKDFTENRP